MGVRYGLTMTAGGPQKVVIIGAGGFGREVLDVIEAMQSGGEAIEFLGFVDDGTPDPALLERRGLQLIGSLDLLAEQGATFVVGIGDPVPRRRMAAKAGALGIAATKAVHPTATFGAEVTSGPGLIACAHVSVTTNIMLGDHVHLNLNTTVGHDCTLGDYVTVNPGASISGDVHLGHGVTIGTGASVIQGVSVGAGTFVGAGAVVTRDLPPNVVAVGSPAKPRRSLNPQG